MGQGMFNASNNPESDPKTGERPVPEELLNGRVALRPYPETLGSEVKTPHGVGNSDLAGYKAAP